jgi:tetratricopeptide (TPR) repeat protein
MTSEVTVTQKYSQWLRVLNRGRGWLSGLTLSGLTWPHVVTLVVLAYALLAGLRTVTDWDLGWQMATARWIVQHHQLPSTDVLSYTAAGRPWKYPVGSGLIFYCIYLAGNYALLSIVGAVACVSTVGLLLRRGSLATAALAMLAIPRIAIRSTPRAEIFSIVLFAAFLTLLWQHYETGRARLWLLPVMMVAWVNLHLGMTAGLGLLAGYVLLECLEMAWVARRRNATDRLRRAWPWLLATIGAVLINPWGWGVFATSLRFMAPVASNARVMIAEWGPVKLDWITVVSGLSLRTPNSTVMLLLAASIAVPVALIRRQLGAALWLCCAVFLGVRHERLLVFFAMVVVVVGGSVLTSALAALRRTLGDEKLYSIVTGGACCVMVLLACVWSADLVADRTYLRRNDIASFGTGLGWWFPQSAAAFIEREKLPGQIFNTYNEGGYIAWSLGPGYKDYVDGRGDPFGAELIAHSSTLVQTPPDSPEWQREAERYGINAIIVPLGRYSAVDEFPLLRQFCDSATWRPVYLDETSAVFLRHGATNDATAADRLIARLQINCDTAPIPAVPPTGNDSRAFNQWANAASVLRALGRAPEALAATTKAVEIFPDCAFLRFTRADLFEKLADFKNAEAEFLISASLLPDAANWTRLAKLYERERRLPEAIAAWKRSAELAPNNASIALLNLGFDSLRVGQPRQALDAFRDSQTSFQKENQDGPEAHKPYYANLSHGQAAAYEALGDVNRAIAFEEATVRLTPERREDWLELAKLYDLSRRPQDAERARMRAAELGAR